MKKQFIYIVLWCIACCVAGCSNEAVYITEPTTISLVVHAEHTTASTVQVEVVPEDDRAYYFVECIPASNYRPGSMDRDYMILKMDSAYIAYLNWRAELLQKNEEFVAPFSSHCLKYGVQDVHFTELEPLQEYLVYAFCVNPENNQPMGKLYYTYFTTDSLRKVEIGFQLHFEGLTLYVMPSRDDVRYFADVAPLEVIEQTYGGSPVNYMTHLLNTCKEYHLLDYYLYQNAASRDLTYEVMPDSYYLLMAAGYDGDFTSEILSRKCYIDAQKVPHLLPTDSIQ